MHLSVSILGRAITQGQFVEIIAAAELLVVGSQKARGELHLVDVVVLGLQLWGDGYLFGEVGEEHDGYEAQDDEYDYDFLVSSCGYFEVYQEIDQFHEFFANSVDVMLSFVPSC